jgi:uncharacterized membrane protein YqjE
MSQETITRSLWLGHSDPIPAQDDLHGVVAALTRARHLQLLVDHGFGGLLVGLGLATVAVLVTRLVPSPYSPWQAAGAVVIVALAVALWVGWRRLPDALDVAIRADLMLRLKQRLSTAWEFMAVHGSGGLAERLAVQAVKAGLPARPRLVFPLRVNRWGRLVPLAAIALVLVSVLDLNRAQAPVPREVDERVVSEGQRLGDFARAMQARARRDELPRSARQAAQIERLGARMEGGAPSRAQALEQLRQLGRSLDAESMQALAEANDAGSAPPRGESGGASAGAPRLNAGAPERTTMGTLHSDDTRALEQRLDDIVRSRIPRGELEEGTRRQETRNDERPRAMLEQSPPGERARKEHEELQRAREQVSQAQENLGESLARSDGGRDAAANMEAAEREEDSGDDSWDKPRGGGKGVTASRFGLPSDSTVASERQQSLLHPESGQSGPVLKPQSQLREGEVFVSEGRILPRPVQPSVENVEMSREFASQVEEVLSKEHYPAHYKEFIRRYFLTLSQGTLAPQQQPSGKR